MKSDGLIGDLETMFLYFKKLLLLLLLSFVQESHGGSPNTNDCQERIATGS